jgi:hypothetical protein
VSWDPLRRPPGRETESVRDYLDMERAEGLGTDWLHRYFALRRRGLVMPILSMSQDGSGYFVATNMASLWQLARFVTVGDLRRQIEAIEKRDGICGNSQIHAA